MGNMRSVPAPGANRGDAFTLQTLTEADAVGGAVTRTWANVNGDDATRRGTIKQMGSQQLFASSQTKFQATHKLEVRYVASLVDVVDLTIFRWTRGGLVYNIGNIEDVDNAKQVTVCDVTVSSI